MLVIKFILAALFSGMAADARAVAASHYALPEDVWNIPLGITTKELALKHPGLRPIVLSPAGSPDEAGINMNIPDQALIGKSKSSFPDVIFNIQKGRLARIAATAMFPSDLGAAVPILNICKTRWGQPRTVQGYEESEWHPAKYIENVWIERGMKRTLVIEDRQGEIAVTLSVSNNFKSLAQRRTMTKDELKEFAKRLKLD